MKLSILIAGILIGFGLGIPLGSHMSEKVSAPVIFADWQRGWERGHKSGWDSRFLWDKINSNLPIYRVTNTVWVTNSKALTIIDAMRGDDPKALANALCSKIGHKWESGCPMVGCLVIHNEPMRHCTVCSLTQTAPMPEWK